MKSESDAKPLVSVVMCVYNGMAYIRSAIESVLNQTYSNWELIISDDGSTDGTTEWLKSNFRSNEKVRLFFQPKNIGYVLNKNFALAQASGEYITQQDSDDLSDPRRLEAQVKVLEDRKIKIVGSGYSRIDANSILLNNVSLKEDTVFTTFSDEEFPFWFPGLMIHRDVYSRLGYFDEYFSGVYGDDYYWTIRAIEHYPIYCLKAPLYVYRNNPVSLTNSFQIRKLIIPAVLKHLREQRQKEGTDWLEQKDLTALRNFERRLAEDKVFVSEQVRVWARRPLIAVKNSKRFDCFGER
jgi:glycosyltransferase involved in cell wall biosynthesis